MNTYYNRNEKAYPSRRDDTNRYGYKSGPRSPLPPEKEKMTKTFAYMAQTNMTQTRNTVVQEIVHELRNPLTAIKMANDLLQQEFEAGNALTNDAKLFTEIIQNNICRLDTLIRGLLYENKEEPLVMTKINLSQLIDSVLSEARDRILLDHIEIKKNYAPSCITHGHPTKLSVVFLNIIINAVEAIKKEKGKIWIWVYPANNKKIHVVIKDNGHGIAAELLEKIFDANFTQKEGGIGLGLTNVKGILDAHEAIITVDSQKDVGTSFLIQFNAAE